MKLYKKLKENLIYVLMLCVFAIMSIWSMLTPIWVDDWRSIINGVPLNFSQIVQTQIEGYFTWSGRVWGEGISRILVTLPRPIWGILNGLVFLLLSLFMLKLVNKKIVNSKSAVINYIFIIVSLFLLTPDFGQVFLWTSGSGNYLWTTTINLLFVYLFLNVDKFKNGYKLATYIAMIPISIISGWCNETTGGAVLIFLLGTVIINLINGDKLKFNYKKICIVLLYVVFYIILLIAPGNSVRAKTLNADFIHKSLLLKLSIRIPQINDFISNYMIWILVVFVGLLVLNVFLIKNIQRIETSILWVISGLAAFYALTLSPALDVTANRIFFTGFIFIIIGTINLIPRIFENVNLNMIITFSLITLIGITALKVTTGIIDSEKTNIAIKHRYAYISNEKNHLKNKKIIYVPPLEYIGNTKYSVDYGTMWDLETNQNDGAWAYPNSEYEIMYGVPKILLKK